MSERSAPIRQRTRTPTDSIRRSIEVEYWVIDEQGRLTEPDTLVEASPGVEREFVEPLLEIKTTPCETSTELREQLYTRLTRVLNRADSQGKRLVPLATPLVDGDIDDLPSERTRIQELIVGDNFEYVRHCAGTHIHFEQQPGWEVEQFNTLVALDPALALVNSSPCYGTSPLAAGARSKLYRWMAYDNLPYQGQLWSYVDDTEEWAQRLERRYQEFVTEGVIAGLDRETIHAHFEPESAIWTPVKFRQEFSTVEWRSPDSTLPSQILRLAEDLTSILSHCRDAELRIEGETGYLDDASVVLPEFDAVQSFVQAGIRDGLSSEVVRSYLDRMGFDLQQYDPLSVSVARETLTERRAREIRLAYADKLSTDIRKKSPMNIA